MDNQVVTPKPTFQPPSRAPVGNALENDVGQVVGRLAVKRCGPRELRAHIGDGGLEATAVATRKALDLVAQGVGFDVVAPWFERRRAVERRCCRTQVFNLLRCKRTPDLAF